MEQAVWAPYGNEQFTTFLSERMDFDKSYHHLLFNQDYIVVRDQVADVVSPIGAVEVPDEPPLPDRGARSTDPGPQSLVSGVASAAAQQGCAGLRRCCSS